MLVSILPGLRDLRTPLATGYLWLLALWLLFHSHVPTKEHRGSGPVGAVYELSTLVGSTATLAALSFVAYLIGSMLSITPKHRNLTLLHPRLRSDLPTFTPEHPGSGAIAYANSPSSRRTYILSWDFRIRHFFRVRRQYLGDQLFVQLYTHMARILREVKPDDRTINETLPDRTYLYWTPTVIREQADPSEIDDNQNRRLTFNFVEVIVTELDAVAIQLQAKNRDFWDSYDRQNSEAQFRYGISPPLSIIILIVAIQSNQFGWLALFVVPIALLALARILIDNSTSILVQAVVLNMVDPPIIAQLKEAIAQRASGETPE